MKVSNIIAKFLYKNNVTHVFELSGGMITNLLDAISIEKKIEIITMHHEQGAAFAVDGFARSKNNGISVAFATSGPGATNLLTGIGSCFFDSVPAIFITGQVNQKEQKGDRKIRQLGFQETDIVSMAQPISKACFQIKSADEVIDILSKSFEIAISGRPGPVLIDIPMNIQSQDLNILNEDIKEVIIATNSNTELKEEFWKEFYKEINCAKKPLILSGRGIIVSNSVEKLIDFSRKTDIPIVYSLLGKIHNYEEEELNVGMIGTYGNRWANISIGESDLLIVLGSRLDIRQTGADIDSFMSNKKIYHIDIDENEINNRLSNCISIVDNASNFLERAIKNIPSDKSFNNQEWKNYITILKNKWSDVTELQNIIGINPNKFIEKLSKHVDSKNVGIYTADVGSHQMWVAQSLRLKTFQRFITSGGMGAMGYSLPAAIGAYFASKKVVVSISGDGGFQLNIQELQTIKRLNIPIKIIILNNQSLGMIRQFQDSYFDSRYQSTVWGYNAPNFEEISLAYGIKSFSIENEEEIEKGLSKMFEFLEEPFLLQVKIDLKTNVYPKIAFGRPISEMEPFAEPIEIEGT
jgi:acetolactate synthase-1/2/3 large subunit